MNELAEIIARHDKAPEGNLARRILDPLTAHDDILRYLASIEFDRVRFMQPLARGQRADALPRAARWLDELPSAVDLENWYRATTAALEGRPDEDLYRVLVALAMDTLWGRLQNPRVAIDAFVVALADAGHSPQIVAGGVKRAWTQCRSKPSISAFLKLCDEHRAEVKTHDAHLPDDRPAQGCREGPRSGRAIIRAAGAAGFPRLSVIDAIRPARQLVVEHRSLPARYAARPDDRVQLRNVIAMMRDVPRESTASMPDMLFLLRRLAGTLQRIEGDLEVVTPPPVQMRRRIAGQKPSEAAEAVFGPARPALKRDAIREIVVAKGGGSK